MSNIEKNLLDFINEYNYYTHNFKKLKTLKNNLKKSKYSSIVDSLYKHLKKHRKKKQLILFHAPWCSASQNFYPLWKNLINKYKFITFLDFDGDNNKNILYKFDVDSYPTIFFNIDGAIYKYNDDFNELDSFIKSNLF